MKCQGAQDLFVDSLYGELDAKRAGALQAHLETCPTCAARLAELARVRERVSVRPDPEPSTLAVQRVLAHARDEGVTPRPSWGLGWLKVALPLCFVVVVGGWIVSQYALTPRAKAPLLPEKSVQERSRVPDAPAGQGGAIPKKEVSIPENPEETAPTPPPLTEEPALGKPKQAETRVEAPSSAPSPLPAEKVRPKEARVGARPKTVAPSKTQEVLPAPPPPRPLELEKGIETAPTSPAVPPAGHGAKEAPLHAMDRGQPLSRSAVDREVQSQAEEAPPADRDKAPEPARSSTVEAKPKASAPAVMGAGAGTSRQTSSSPLALLERGEALLQTREFQRAEGTFSQALSLLQTGQPGRPRALLGLARAKEGLGRYEEARRVYQTLADESSKHREEALRKIRELKGQGDDQK